MKFLNFSNFIINYMEYILNACFKYQIIIPQVILVNIRDSNPKHELLSIILEEINLNS